MATTQHQSSSTSPTSTSGSTETRELYRQKYEAQLREWDAKIEEVKARAEKLDAQARLDMLPHLDMARSHYETARTRLQSLGDAADDTWDDVKRNAESAWNDFKSAVEGAYDALRSRGSSKSS